MRAVQHLPEGYNEIYSIDLQKDQKTALWVNALALILATVMAVPMHFVVPISTLFDMRDGIGAYALRHVVLLAAMVVYLVLHEAVHGITMKLCGTKKVKYGFTGMYAFAGSDDYYDKQSYIIIALAPVVVWGIVIAIVNFLVPTTWFWVVYLIGIFNISGAAGDLFVTFKFIRFPKGILIKDHGVGMHVYSKEG